MGKKVEILDWEDWPCYCQTHQKWVPTGPYDPVKEETPHKFVTTFDSACKHCHIALWSICHERGVEAPFKVPERVWCDDCQKFKKHSHFSWWSYMNFETAKGKPAPWRWAGR